MSSPVNNSFNFKTPFDEVISSFKQTDLNDILHAVHAIHCPGHVSYKNPEDPKDIVMLCKDPEFEETVIDFIKNIASRFFDEQLAKQLHQNKERLEKDREQFCNDRLTEVQTNSEKFNRLRKTAKYCLEVCWQTAELGNTSDGVMNGKRLLDNLDAFIQQHPRDNGIQANAAEHPNSGKVGVNPKRVEEINKAVEERLAALQHSAEDEEVEKFQSSSENRDSLKDVEERLERHAEEISPLLGDLRKEIDKQKTEENKPVKVDDEQRSYPDSLQTTKELQTPKEQEEVERYLKQLDKLNRVAQELNKK